MLLLFVTVLATWWNCKAFEQTGMASLTRQSVPTLHNLSEPVTPPSKNPSLTVSLLSASCWASAMVINNEPDICMTLVNYRQWWSNISQQFKVCESNRQFNSVRLEWRTVMSDWMSGWVSWWVSGWMSECFSALKSQVSWLMLVSSTWVTSYWHEWMSGWAEWVIKQCVGV